MLGGAYFQRVRHAITARERAGPSFPQFWRFPSIYAYTPPFDGERPVTHGELWACLGDQPRPRLKGTAPALPDFGVLW